MEIKKKELFSLSDEENKDLLNCLSGIIKSSKEMEKELEENKLTKESKETLLNNINNLTLKAAELVKYDEDSAKSISNRYTTEKELSEKINILKNQVKNENQVTGIKELIYNMNTSVNHWWRNQGFLTVRDEHYKWNGYNARFSLYLNFNNDKDAMLKKINEAGFEIINSKHEYFLVDTMENRELIKNLLSLKFPSSNIIEFSNYKIDGSYEYVLRSMECIIDNLQDIKSLIDEKE